MRRRIAFLFGLLASALLVPLACDDGDQVPNCQSACNVFAACSLVPSGLGESADDCVDKCVASSSQTRADLFSCTNGISAASASYCPTLGCTTVAQCYITATGTQFSLPTASVVLTVAAAANADPRNDVSQGCSAGASGSGGGGGSAGAPDSGVGSPSVCRDGGMGDSVDVFLVPTLGTARQITVPCTQAGTPQFFDSIDPGQAGVGARLRWQVDGGAQCKAFYGEPLLVLPGDAGLAATIHVTSDDPSKGAACEDTADRCADGLDNDGDGRTDCDDPLCANFCMAPHCDSGCVDAAFD